MAISHRFAQARAVALILWLSIFLSNSKSQENGCAGTLDRTFNPPPSWGPGAFAMDGDSLISTIHDGLIRLRSDGSVDPNFLISIGGSVSLIEKDAMGRWLLAGDFWMVNGISRPAVARLLPDGNLDSTFSLATNVLTKLNSRITALAQQADGKILLVTTWEEGSQIRKSNIVRINSDGSLDQSFTTQGADNVIYAIAALPNGKILVGGYFKTINGTDRNQLCRLNSDGSIDDSYLPSRFIPAVNGLLPVKDGKLLIWWGSDPYFSIPTPLPWPWPTNSLVRLNANGTLDATFKPQPGAFLNIREQSDGKYVVLNLQPWSASPPPLRVNQSCRRLLPNGETDPTFASLIGIGSGGKLALDSQERPLLIGGLTAPGTGVMSIARLLGDASPCVPTIQFETTEAIFVETNGVISIPVIRTGDVNSIASAKVLVSQDSHLAPGRFTSDPVIHFATGETRASISIPIHDNQLREPTHIFRLALGNPISPTVVGFNREIAVTILDASSVGQPGSLDQNFHVQGTGYLDSSVGWKPILVLPNGKILVANAFAEIEGTSPGSVSKFNPDGTLDRSFLTARDSADSLAIFSDRIYVGSVFAKLRRLLANGSADPEFIEPVFFNRFESYLYAITAHADGKVLAAGSFLNINGILRTNLVRFNRNGAVDQTFDPGLSSSGGGVLAVTAWAAKTYLVLGGFDEFSGQFRQCIAHLSTNGTLLNDFQISRPLSSDSYAQAFLPEPDGGILIGGSFRFYDDSTTRPLIRFTKEGLFDEAFNAPPVLESYVALLRQPDGKIIASGWNSNEYWYDQSATRLLRLHPDGRHDPTFYPGVAARGPGIALDGFGSLYVSTIFEHGFLGGLFRLRTGDYTGPGIFTLSGPTNVFENSGSIKLTITRHASAQGEARLRVTTTDGTARTGFNYAAIDHVVTFADGEGGEKEVFVPLLNNPAPAKDIFLTVNLRAESPGIAVMEGNDSMRIAIADDEPAFWVTPVTGNVHEGWLDLEVNRTGPYNGPATVSLLTEPGTATENIDYEPLNQIVSFDNPSATSRRVFFQIKSDDLFEGVESIRVSLKNPSTGMALLNPSTLNLHVFDNPEKFEFAEPVIFTDQTQKEVRLVIRRAETNVIQRFPTISFKTEAGSAIPGVEFQPTEGTLTAPGIISIPLLPNSLIGSPTTFHVRANVIEGEAIFPTNLATIVLQHPTAIAPAGTIDPSFSVTFNHYSQWNQSVAWTSNSIYVLTGDDFLRFDHNGALDPDFRRTRYFNKFLPDADGSILILNTNAGIIERLLPDGIPDFSYIPRFSRPYVISDFLSTPEGKIIVGGAYLLNDYAKYPFVGQMLPDGSKDPNFTLSSFGSPTGQVTTLNRMPDGKIIAGGTFPQKIIRLLPDGQIDPQFTATPAIAGAVEKVLALPTGKIIVSAQDILRLQPSGVLDETFTLEPLGPGARVLQDADAQGRLYFSVGEPAIYPRLMRVLPDGKIDRNFFPPAWATKALVTPRGLLAFGIVSNDWFGFSSRIVHLFEDPAAALRPPQLLPNGNIQHTFNFPAGIPYSFEESPDLINWTELKSGTLPTDFHQFETQPTPGPAKFYRLRQKTD